MYTGMISRFVFGLAGMFLRFEFRLPLAFENQKFRFTGVWSNWFLTFSALFLLTSCKCNLQTYNHDIPCSAVAIPAYCPPKKPMRLALVLGAGGARGMAHIGVLEEFEKAGIPVDLIVGSSAGSLVGSLYARNPNACEIKAELARLRKDDFLEFNLFIRCQALCYGYGLKKFLLKHLGNSHFEELQIPLVVVATDLYEGDLVVLGSGAVAPAVHASCAYPLVLSPVKVHGKVLVDGGVINPIPVQIARQHSPDVIVAVDISSYLPQRKPNNLFGVAKRCTEIQFLTQSNLCVGGADYVIKPELGEVGTFDHTYNEEVYLAGRHAARAAIPAIRQILSEKSKN